VLQSDLAEFWGWRIFMQIRQRIFKCFTMQICRLFLTVFWNFWRITRLSTTNHHWVINAQTGPVFWPTLYMTVWCIVYRPTRLNSVDGSRLIIGPRSWRDWLVFIAIIGSGAVLRLVAVETSSISAFVMRWRRWVIARFDVANRVFTRSSKRPANFQQM